jgi:hypothetical protein
VCNAVGSRNDGDGQSCAREELGQLVLARTAQSSFTARDDGPNKAHGVWEPLGVAYKLVDEPCCGNKLGVIQWLCSMI